MSNITVDHISGEFGLTNKIKTALEEAGRQFIYIGFLLDEAETYEYYLEAGYENIYDYCEAEFGFKRSSTNNFIRVYRQFGNAMYLEEKYQKYTYSQLTEMCSMTPQQLKKCNSDMTVRQLRAIKKGETPVELTYTELEEDSVQTSGQAEEIKKSEITLETVQTSGQNERQHLFHNRFFNEYLCSEFCNSNFLKYKNYFDFQKDVSKARLFYKDTKNLSFGCFEFWVSFGEKEIKVSFNKDLIVYTYCDAYFRIKRMIENDVVSVYFPRQFIIRFFNNCLGGISDNWDVRYIANLSNRNDEFVQRLFTAIGYKE